MRRCPVTGGLPTRMSYDGFVAACRARRGRAGCEEWCGGMPQELEIIKGGLEMGKTTTIKEQIAQALAPLKAELEDREARVAVLEDQHVRDQERIAELEAELATWQEANKEGSAEFLALNESLRAEAERLREELAEARRIIAQQAGEVSAARREIGEGIDLSAAIYRDALADFAIRVLSGGVAVSFHEARP